MHSSIRMDYLPWRQIELSADDCHHRLTVGYGYSLREASRATAVLPLVDPIATPTRFQDRE